MSQRCSSGSCDGRRLRPPGRVGAQRAPVGGRHVHEEIVRVLPVHDQPALVGLPHLEELGRAGVRDGGRLEREHPHQRQPSAPERAVAHPQHPVRGFERLLAGRPALVVHAQAHDAQAHPLPPGLVHPGHRVARHHAGHPAHVAVEQQGRRGGGRRRRATVSGVSGMGILRPGGCGRERQRRGRGPDQRVPAIQCLLHSPEPRSSRTHGSRRARSRAPAPGVRYGGRAEEEAVRARARPRARTGSRAARRRARPAPRAARRGMKAPRTRGGRHPRGPSPRSSSAAPPAGRCGSTHGGPSARRPARPSRTPRAARKPA
jgi:hypothetical protein